MSRIWDCVNWFYCTLDLDFSFVALALDRGLTSCTSLAFSHTCEYKGFRKGNSSVSKYLCLVQAVMGHCFVHFTAYYWFLSSALKSVLLVDSICKWLSAPRFISENPVLLRINLESLPRVCLYVRLSHFFLVFVQWFRLKCLSFEGEYSLCFSGKYIWFCGRTRKQPKNKNLCKFWDAVLGQKRKRLLKGTGKHKADKVGWNGIIYLDDSHSWRHWLLGVCSEYFI